MLPQIERTATPAGLRVDSEVGTLRRVILHRPDLELRRLTPHPGRAHWAPDWGRTRTRRAARSGSVGVMNTTDIRPPFTAHHQPIEVGAEIVEETGVALRIAEVDMVIFLGLLVCPPLLILAVVVAVPFVAISAVVAAAVAAVVVPTLLVRHVRAHHRAHGSTLFLHRLRP
jgi:hypothetical protein